MAACREMLGGRGVMEVKTVRFDMLAGCDVVCLYGLLFRFPFYFLYLLLE